MLIPCSQASDDVFDQARIKQYIYKTQRMGTRAGLNWGRSLSPSPLPSTSPWSFRADTCKCSLLATGVAKLVTMPITSSEGLRDRGPEKKEDFIEGT